MANINSKWHRYLACGCSHGDLADESALDAVLKFKSRWKPETILHLGDFVDMTAFRSGAVGTRDEARNLGIDANAGIGFLERLEPTHVFNGNHEDRLWDKMYHHNAIISECAGKLVNDIRRTITRLRARHFDVYDSNDPRSMFKLGDTKFMHGWWFNENAHRDHAEHFGKCVIAHLHTPGSAHGRRDDHPVATCVGMLADRRKLIYAKSRRATARWNHGFVWGEYNSRECIVWLSERNHTGNDWRLPL